MTIPMEDVAGKVAFITGGSSGIGLGIARAFTDAGMKVAIGYRSRAHLNEALADLRNAKDRVVAIRVDVTDRAALERAAAQTVKAFGKVHVIVNNAGVQSSSSLGAMTYDDWDSLMSVNVYGVFNGVQAFLPHIKAHGEGGQVVATASIAGLFTVGAKNSAYCASKFAVVAMMESLRVELAGSNIGVSALCPGVVKSNLEQGLKDIPVASDALHIGHMLLRGMRRNDLYVLTHPEFDPVITLRCQALLAASPMEISPNEARLAFARSVANLGPYRTELNRQGNPSPIGADGMRQGHSGERT